MISLKEALIRKNIGNVGVNVDNVDRELKDQEILKFIKENYNIKVGPYLQVEFDHPEKYISLHDDIVDIIDGASITLDGLGKARNATSLTNGLFKFGKIDGNFSCAYCKKLKTLEGAPEYVKGEFVCDYCEDLSSLKGSPEQCAKFLCNHCSKLTSLKGISKKIDYSIEYRDCPNLKSIDDIPSDFDGRLIIDSVYDFDLSKFKGKCDIYAKHKIIEKSGKVFIPKKIKNGTVYGWKELRSNTTVPLLR